MWYVFLRSPVPVLNGSKSHETSSLSQHELPHTNQHFFGNQHSVWILPNWLGKTQKISLCKMWEDFLCKHGHSLSSSPASAHYFRPSCCFERRGREQILDRRAEQIAWNTVDRWLEKASAAGRRFNHQSIFKIRIRELQVDEIRTMVGGNGHPPVWIFAAIEVWSRLWPATVVGRRSYRNTLSLFQDILSRVKTARVPLVATDGFKYYRQVVKRIFGVACLYGQVINKRRKDRVVSVQRKARTGAT